MSPDLSIIIVSYNVKNYLRHCLVSVLKAAEKLETEIFVVDNHSLDGSADMVKTRFPGVTCIANSDNRGFGKANNQALRQSEGKYVLFLNPDTLVEENTFTSLVDYMDTHPETGLCGPRILNSDGTLQLACRRSFPTPAVALPKLLGLSSILPKSKIFAKYNLTYLNPDDLVEVDAVSGSFMFGRGDLLRSMDGFDEIFFMYGEDLDLCRRIQLKGYKICYNPVTTIIHHKGESSKSAPFDSLMAFYGAMDIFFKKHFSKFYSIFTTVFFRLGIALHLFFRFLGGIFYKIRLPLADMCLIIISFATALALRFGFLAWPGRHRELSLSILICTAVYLVSLAAGGAYKSYKRYDFMRAAAGLIPGLLINSLIILVIPGFPQSRFILFVSFAFIFVLLSGWRIIAYRIRSRHYRQNQEQARKTLVVGAGDEGKRISAALAAHPELGYLFIGYADRDFSNPKTITKTDSLIKTVKSRHINHVIFSSDVFTLGETIDMISGLAQLPVNIKIVPEKENLIHGKVNLESLKDVSVVNMEYRILKPGFSIVKRLFDLLISVIALLLLAPFAWISKWISGSRISNFSRELKKCHIWTDKNGKQHAFYWYPMLFSVLTGKMSFVGDLKNLPEGSRRFYKAGITNIMRSEQPALPTAEEHERFVHYYMSNYSLTLDVEILIKTLFVRKDH